MKKTVLLSFLIFLLVLVAPRRAFGHSFEDYGLQPAAIIVEDGGMETFNSVRAIVERGEGRGLLYYPPWAVFGYFPSELDAGAFERLPVRVVRSDLELVPGRLDSVVRRAVRGMFRRDELLEDVEIPRDLPFNDLLLEVPQHIVPQTHLKHPQKGAPREISSRGIDQNSEFMIGSVLINVIFPESVGSGENWTDDEIGNAIRDLSLGCSLYQNHAHWAGLSFMLNYRNFKQVPVTVEPIMTNFIDGSDRIWIYEALEYLGYENGNDVWLSAHQLNQATRSQYQTDWVFTAFIADQSAHYDPEAPYPDPGCWGGAGYTAYAYLGGPYLVVPFPGCRLGYGVTFGQLFDHEMSHTFWALDEYPSANVPCTARSGYLDMIHGNSLMIPLGQSQPCGEGLDCIMWSVSLSNNPVCPYTMGQIGLGDENENSVPDIYEVYPEVDFLHIPGYSSDTTFDGTFNVAVRATNDAVPNRNTRQSPLTQIDYAPWLTKGWIGINEGFWKSVHPSIGLWDSSEEEFAFILTEGLEPGRNEIHFMVENCVGLRAQASAEVTYIGIRFYQHSAFVDPEHIEISWKTAKEIFGADFEIMKQDLTLGIPEEVLAVVDGDSVTESGRHSNFYSFRDEEVVAGHRYRYQIIGKFEIELNGEIELFTYSTSHMYKTALIPIASGIMSAPIPNPTDHRGTTFTVKVPKSYFDPADNRTVSGSSVVYPAPSLMEVRTDIDISVYNVNGQRVRQVYSSTLFGGMITKYWDCLDERGRMVSPGVYFIRVKAGHDLTVKKVVVLQ